MNDKYRGMRNRRNSEEVVDHDERECTVQIEPNQRAYQMGCEHERPLFEFLFVVR